MKSPELVQPLSQDAQRIIAEVVSQFEGYDEAVRGLCAKGKVSHIKHGLIGPPDEHEEIEERLDDPDAQDSPHNVLPFLISEDYERLELSSTNPNELSIRATRGDEAASDNEALGGADLTFTKEPIRLVRAVLHPPSRSGVGALLMKMPETEVLFRYVRGIPLPVKAQMHFRSLGIGRLRVDQEVVMEVHYEPCT